MSFRNAMTVLVLGLSLGVAGTALSASSGAPTGAVSTGVGAQAYNSVPISYGSFSTAACTTGGFAITAVGTLTTSGTLDMVDQIQLNGVNVAVQTFQLSGGPGTFNTGFSLVGSPSALPYTETYNFSVFQTGNLLGTEIVTVTCTSAGTTTASSAWVPASSIPTLSEWALIALGMLLLAVGIVAVRRRMPAA